MVCISGTGRRTVTAWRGTAGSHWAPAQTLQCTRVRPRGSRALVSQTLSLPPARASSSATCLTAFEAAIHAQQSGYAVATAPAKTIMPAAIRAV